MQLKNITVEIIVRGDYQTSYDFYTKKLGLIPAWGDNNGPYTAFTMREGESEWWLKFVAWFFLEWS
jgi:catechol 2,3-dioxygenase-like lactoylglutathione lyase family enzyme